MKVMAKLLSLVLALTLVLGNVGFAATYSDVDSTKSYSSAVSLLSALKLLKGYDDGTFKPEGDITRAEFATVVVRALGQEDSATSAAGSTNFTDVAADSWASGYIKVASTLGIVNGFGDGRFGPEENVTYEQAVKMVVCALGYEVQALSSVGNDPTKIWPAGYLNAANQLNLVNGVAGSEGVAAKRWQVARLVYNSLDVNVMEKVIVNGEDKWEVRDNKTILSDKLNIEVGTGELRANTKDTVTDKKSRTGEVIIYDNESNEEDTFKDGGLSTDSMIGHSIKFYYTKTNDDVKTLLYIEDKTGKSDILNVDASAIDNVSGTLTDGFTLEYWENEDTDSSTKSVETAENPTVMINGRVAEGVTKDDLMPISGSIQLIDSGNSGSYDKVLITSYETYVVKSVNSTDKKIVDKYRTTDNTITIDEDDNSIDVTIKNISGTALTFSNIAAWNVLSVKKSNASSKNTMDVTVSTKTVSGTITEVSGDDAISIDGKAYKVSPYYLKYAPDNTGTYVEFKVDDSGKFYLDKDDKIAAYDKTAAANSYYGYLRRAEYKDDKLTLEMFSQNNGSLSKFTGASKIKIDGQSKSKEEAIGELNNAVSNVLINSDTEGKTFDSGYYPQLIRYTLNSSGQVSVIQNVNGTELSALDVGYASGLTDSQKAENLELIKVNTMDYVSANKQFVSKTNKFIIDSSTIVFTVPNDRTKDDDYTRVTNYSSYFSNNDKYCIEAYDCSGTTNVAKAVVVYVSQLYTEVNGKSPVAFIENIKSVTNSSNPDYNKLVTAYVSGYNLAPTEVNLNAESTVEPTEGNNYDVGDVIMYTTTSEGYIRTSSVLKVYDVHNAMTHVDIHKGTSDYYDVNLYNGYLYTADNQSFELVTDKTITNPADITKDSTRQTFTVDSSTKKYVYDATLSDNKLSELNADMSSMPSVTGNSTTPAEIFVYVQDEAVKAVYYIKNR